MHNSTTPTHPQTVQLGMGSSEQYKITVPAGSGPGHTLKITVPAPGTSPAVAPVAKPPPGLQPADKVMQQAADHEDEVRTAFAKYDKNQSGERFVPVLTAGEPRLFRVLVGRFSSLSSTCPSALAPFVACFPTSL